MTRWFLMFAWVLVSSLALPLAADELRTGDQLLDSDGMQDQVVGRTHTFFDGGRSFFPITDTYTYTYPDGGVAYGRYEMRGDGVVCTFFNHGYERCDAYVRTGERLVLITSHGPRFPVKDVS